MSKKTSFILLFLGFVFIVSCSGINLFSTQDDKDLGAQFHQEILSDPSTYPILSESQYPQAYAYLRGIRDEILNSGNVELKDEFEWNVFIIRDDETLNAFATPGGYLYFYTGLIKYLQNEDDFAGVMAHEIAHADKRHSTESLTTQYGSAILLDIIFGNSTSGQIASIVSGLASLEYSRDAESEADEYSVRYLSQTEYACDGAAGFFEQLVAEGNANSGPEFLSTHPSPDNRVEDINATAAELDCSTSLSGNDFASFQNMLP